LGGSEIEGKAKRKRRKKLNLDLDLGILLLLSPPLQARGILDPDSQTLLVDAWQSARDSSSSGSSSSGSESEGETEGEDDDDEPSRYSSPRRPTPLPASVAGRVASPEAAAAQGDAALSLHALLGSRPELDVPSMCAREPQLLEVGNALLMTRLLFFRGRGPPGLDVGSLVSSQPSLLLQPLSPSDSSANESLLTEEETELLEKEGRESEEEDESPEELLRSWKAGLVSDSDAHWVSNFAKLKLYVSENGDAAVGSRGRDDPALVRWAEKQRADFAGAVVGEGGGSFRRRNRSSSSSFSSSSTSSQTPRPSFLKPSRRALLESAGFCFDAEEAEFSRMVAAAARAGAGGEGATGSGAATATREIGGGSGRGGSGGGSGIGGANPESGRGDELLLANWCSVQRIAKRSGVLSAERIAQLEAIGFDFDGADALS